MAKRRITPERREQRKKLLEMLQDAGINDVAGVRIYSKNWSAQSCRMAWKRSWTKSSVTASMTTAIK
jgi:hypothetical protein